MQVTPKADAIRLSGAYSTVYSNYTEYARNAKIKIRFEPVDFFIRDHNPNYLDIAICIYLIGMVLRDLKKVILHGIKEYVFEIKNIFNCVLIILFACSFGLKFYTLIQVSAEMEKLVDPNFWAQISQLENSSMAQQQNVFTTFYWLNRDRFYWQTLDPINLSEGLFATSIVLALGRLCFWLPANQNLGPLQITLGQMISVSS